MLTIGVAQGIPVISAPPQPTAPTGGVDEPAGDNGAGTGDGGGNEVRPDVVGVSPFDVAADSGARGVGVGLVGVGLVRAAAAVCGVVFLLVR